ncbi:glycosyltransferase [Candidatus Parcubacteria bacterium]|nr:MAG: glycosyltransferase [Candidatus Parcubacteria bacterium]
MKTSSPNRKKVLYVITKATYGGAQKYVHDLATNLSEQEFEPIVAYGTHGKLADDLSSAGIQVRQLPSLGRDIAIISDMKSFFEILKTVRELKPDMIHLNSSKAAAFGALAARIAGVPKIIFTVHGWPFKENRNILARTAIYAISWFTALMSSAIIVVSKSDERIGKRMPGVGGKIHHIQLGAELPTFLSREEAADTLAIQTKDVRIVTIAELTLNKGIRFALETIKKLEERGLPALYVVIGDGESRAELEHTAKILGISERVRFVGFLSDAARYLKAFDLFLLPSIKEGAPYVLIEAGAASLPIVMTTAANIEIVEHFPNVRVVSAGDPDALADAIVETLGDKTETELFPEKFAFSVEGMLEKTAALYF